MLELQSYRLFEYLRNKNLKNQIDLLTSRLFRLHVLEDQVGNVHLSNNGLPLIEEVEK